LSTDPASILNVPIPHLELNSNLQLPFVNIAPRHFL
jgi:hypothetical protein